MLSKFSKIALAVSISSVLASTATFAAKSPYFFINTNVVATSDAAIEHANTDLSTTAYGLSVGNELLTLGLKTTKYNFSGDVDPFDQLNNIYVDVRHEGYFTSNIAYYVGANLGFLYEDSIDVADSYNFAPRAVLGWTFLNGMTAFGGVYVNLNAADNIVLPIIGLQVGKDKDHGWTGAIAYPKTKLQYRFSPALAVNATFETVRDTYHLDNDYNRKGDVADGFMREESYGVSLGATYTLNKSFNISAGVLSYYDRQFDFYNKNGHKVASFEVDNNYGGYIDLNFVF